MSRFRYARKKVRIALVVAAALTAFVSGTVWMLARAFHVLHADLYAMVSAAVFFAFMSVTMLWRSWRDEIVLAILPTGLRDLRWQPDPVAWDAIREIVVRRREDEVELDVFLWQPATGRTRKPAERRPDYTIELASLDASADAVIAAIGEHAAIRYDKGADGTGANPLLRARG